MNETRVAVATARLSFFHDLKHFFAASSLKHFVAVAAKL